MIFVLFCLQSVSITLASVTTVYDIDNVIKSYLSHTMDEHVLHATSLNYMQIVQDETHLPARYYQSVRYVKYGFPMYTNTSLHQPTNSTNDNVYKKFNFIQSIGYYYCGINMSDLMNISLDNIVINESQLYMNSVIFPVQLVESYELIRSEICERIKLGLYQSVVDIFNPYANTHSFFSGFIGIVANFISSKPSESFSLQRIGQIYPFLAKFGEFEPYKEAVIDHILNIDKLRLAFESNVSHETIVSDIDLCASQIQHPKMHQYVTDILEQQAKSTDSQFFILNHHNTSDFYAQMYKHVTGGETTFHKVENNVDTVEIYHVLALFDECRKVTENRPSNITMSECMFLAVEIHELAKHFIYGIDGHAHVVNSIKYIISNHDVYLLKIVPSDVDPHHHDWSDELSELQSLVVHLRVSSIDPAFYPYLNELMNDTQFVNIVNNITDSELDEYLQPMLYKMMVLALEEYKDIEMIKKIATVFAPKINICRNIMPLLITKKEWDLTKISWMDLLMKHECMYLTKYFQQTFRHQLDNCSSAWQVNQETLVLPEPGSSKTGCPIQ